jgi:hypothetical protein
LLTHAVILVTPGFFTSDEWQRFDYVHSRGYWEYALTFGALRAGPEFAYPVRPLGFLQQGIAAEWMQSAPWAAHLVGVLNHALVALTFVWVLRRAGVATAIAGLAGAFFVLSPLTTLATGWVAASFDPLYVLFLLLAAAAIVRLPIEGMTPQRAFCIVVATAAALLSKETAVVAPAGVLLLGYLRRASHPAEFSWRPYIVALVLVLIPVSAYLLFRAPSLAASFAGNVTGAYAPDATNVPVNAFRYFAFPFRPRLIEMSDSVFRSPWQPAAASLVHLLLVAAVFRLLGAAFALAYLAGYFLFLAPILALPNPGPHYLYGAGLAMSLALAAVLARLLASRRTRLAWIVLVGVAVLYAHNLAIQALLFQHGECQSRFLNDVDALLARATATHPTAIRVIAEEGALTRVAIRAVAARQRYIANGVALVSFEGTVDKDAASPQAGAIRVRMTAACRLVP